MSNLICKLQKAARRYSISLEISEKFNLKDSQLLEVIDDRSVVRYLVKSSSLKKRQIDMIVERIFSSDECYPYNSIESEIIDCISRYDNLSDKSIDIIIYSRSPTYILCNICSLQKLNEFHQLEILKTKDYFAVRNLIEYQSFTDNVFKKIINAAIEYGGEAYFNILSESCNLTDKQKNIIMLL